MRGSPQASAGVTLIELMVVLAVIAILATQAAPAFGSFLASRRLSGAASQLVSDLQNARSEAVLRNADVAVTFSATGYTLSAGGSDIRSVTLSGNTLVSAGSNAVITYDRRRGTASSTNANAVTLANSSHSLQITVHTTGRVQCTVVSGSASC